MSPRFIEAISTHRGSVGSFKLSILFFVLSSQLILSIKKGPVDPYIQHAVQSRIMRGRKVARLPHDITVRMIIPEQDTCPLNPEVKEDIHHRIGEYVEFILQVKLLCSRHVGVRIIIAPVPSFQANLYKNRLVEQRAVKKDPAVDEQFRNTEYIRCRACD